MAETCGLQSSLRQGGVGGRQLQPLQRLAAGFGWVVMGSGGDADKKGDAEKVRAQS